MNTLLLQRAVKAAVTIAVITASITISLAQTVEKSTIAAGQTFTLVIKKTNGKGEVYASGLNNWGQLGINDPSVSSSDVPLKVALPPNADIVSVAVGEGHASALDISGEVYSWGRHISQVALHVPTKISGLTGVVGIYSATHRNFAIKDNGTVCWWPGALGAGWVPPQKAGLSNIIHISAGYEAQLALASNGSVYFWRSPSQITGIDNETPQLVSGLPTSIIDIATSGEPLKVPSVRCYALTSTGQVYFWDWNSVLTTPGLILGASPSPIIGLDDITDTLSVFSLAPSNVEPNPIAVKCADGRYRALLGGTVSAASFVSLPIPLCNEIAGGPNLIIARDAFERVWTASELNPSLHESPIPVQVSGLKNITKVCLGASAGAALVANGATNKLYIWEQNSVYKSIPGAFSIPTEVTIPGVTGFSDVAIGSHVLALTNTGELYAWGSNSNGQCASLPTTATINTPMSIRSVVAPAGTTITKVYASGQSSFALLNNNRVRSWGYNASGILGAGNTTDRSTPGYVNTAASTPLTNVVDIDGGPSHALFLIDNSGSRSVRATGYRSLVFGNTGNDLKFATVVTGLSGAAKIRSGANHNLASIGQSLYAFGSNYQGVFGAGDNSPRTGIYSVPSVGSFTDFYVGPLTSYLQTASGIKAWGNNSSGQFGNNTFISSNTVPTNIFPTLSGITNVEAGGSNGTAIGIRDSVGKTAWAWGDIRPSGVWTAPIEQYPVGAGNTVFDTNSNLLGDDWEALFSVQGALPTADLDGDGLTNLQEYLLNTNPTQADSDGDQLNDIASDRVRHQPYVIPQVRLPQVLTEDQSTPTTVALFATTFAGSGAVPTYSVVSSPKANVTISALDQFGPKAVIQPLLNQNGDTYFDYSASILVNGVTYSKVSRVHYHITEVNDSPSITSILFTAFKVGDKEITLSSFDAENDSLVYSYTQPLHGTLTGVGPNLVYTADPGWSGVDTFTCTVTETGKVPPLSSGPITISINVVNRPPIAGNLDRGIVSDTNPTSFQLPASDPDGDPLVYTVTQPSHGEITWNGPVGGPDVIYTPNPTRGGHVNVNFTVSDGIATVNGRVGLDVPPFIRSSVPVIEPKENHPTTIPVFLNLDPVSVGLNVSYSLSGTAILKSPGSSVWDYEFVPSGVPGAVHVGANGTVPVAENASSVQIGHLKMNPDYSYEPDSETVIVSVLPGVNYRVSTQLAVVNIIDELPFDPVMSLDAREYVSVLPNDKVTSWSGFHSSTGFNFSVSGNVGTQPNYLDISESLGFLDPITNQPVTPTVRFVGDEGLGDSNPVNVNLASGCTLVAMLSPLRGTGASEVLSIGNGNSGIQLYQAVDSRTLSFSGLGCFVSAPQVLARNRGDIFTVVVPPGGAPQMFARGTLISTGQTGGLQDLRLSGPSFVGNRFSSNGQYTGVDLAGFYLFPTALNTEQIEGINNYLSERLHFPVVSAGADQFFFTRNVTVFTKLAGSVRRKNGVLPTGVSWSIVSKPTGSAPIIHDPSSLTSGFELSALGKYKLRLTATYPDGELFDDVDITQGFDEQLYIYFVLDGTPSMAGAFPSVFSAAENVISLLKSKIYDGDDVLARDRVRVIVDNNEGWLAWMGNDIEPELVSITDPNGNILNADSPKDPPPTKLIVFTYEDESHGPGGGGELFGRQYADFIASNPSPTYIEDYFVTKQFVENRAFFRGLLYPILLTGEEAITGQFFINHVDHAFGGLGGYVDYPLEPLEIRVKSGYPHSALTPAAVYVNDLLDLLGSD